MFENILETKECTLKMMALSKNPDVSKFLSNSGVRYLSYFKCSTFLKFQEIVISSWTDRGSASNLIFNNICHCIKSVRIRSYSGPYFPAFGLNTERYGVFGLFPQFDTG